MRLAVSYAGASSATLATGVDASNASTFGHDAVAPPRGTW